MSNSHREPNQDPMDEALAEYLARIDHGEKVDREQFLREHPEIEVELRCYFRDADLVDAAAAVTRPAAGFSSASVGRPLGAIHYFGDYELLEVIGQGGMGVVYRAKQRSLNRTVAVKLMRAGLLASAADVARFRREAVTAANLTHPHIVAVYEVGEHEGQQYLSMEFVDGQSLADVVRQGPLPCLRAARYVHRICGAIEYAHEHGTIHRDIKPSNVLLGQNDEPRVADFGLAKCVDRSTDLTLTGTPVGTASYMPPEQAAGRRDEIGPASDVYSLGATLYALVTGRPPFRSDTVAATVYQVLREEPASPRMLNASVDKDLETICLKCLQKDPPRRYACVADLAEDLRRYLHHEPILARPISRSARAWRWCQRNPVVASLLLAVACLLSALAVSSTIGYWRTSRALMAAERTLYVNNIAVAHRQWQDNNVEEAQALLDACPVKERNWEWAYLQRLCNSAILSVPGITCMSLSEDEKWLAAGTSDGTIRLWDTSDWHEVLARQIHSIAVDRILFFADGRLISIGRGDESDSRPAAKSSVLKLTRFPEGLELLSSPVSTIRVGHADYSLLDLSADGRLISTVALDSADESASPQRSSVRIWDAITGKSIRVLDEHGVTCVKFNPDGTKIALGDRTGVTRIVNVATGKCLLSLHDDEKTVPPLPLGADFVPQADPPVNEQPRGDVVTQLSFHSDPQTVVVSYVDIFGSNHRKAWRLDTGGEVDVPEVDGDGQENTPFEVRGVVSYSPLAYSNDHTLCATVDSDVVGRSYDRVVIWDVATHARRLTLRGCQGFIHMAAFGPGDECLIVLDNGGGRVADLGSVGTLRVWTLAHPQEAIRCEFDGHLEPLMFSSDGHRLFCRDTAWNLATGQICGRLPPIQHPYNPYKLRHDYVAINPLGPLLVFDNPESEGVAIRSSSGKGWQVGDIVLQALDVQLTGRVSAAAFSSNGSRVCVITTEGDPTSARLTMLDSGTGRTFGTILLGRGDVFDVAFSPDDWLIAVGFTPYSMREVRGMGSVQEWNGGQVRVLNSRTLEEVAVFRNHKHPFVSLAFNPDGSTIVSAGSPDSLSVCTVPSGPCDPVIRVWETRTGREVRALRGHASYVNDVAFSPDGHRIISASHDGTVRLWHAGTGHELLATGDGSTPFMRVAFSPDGARIAATGWTGGDNVLCVWETALPSGPPCFRQFASPRPWWGAPQVSTSEPSEQPAPMPESPPAEAPASSPPVDPVIEPEWPPPAEPAAPVPEPIPAEPMPEAESPSSTAPSEAPPQDAATEDAAKQDPERTKLAPVALLGKQIPDFEFVNASGETDNASSLRGKVFVLHFWHCCPNCARSLPLLNDVARQFQDNSHVMFLALNLDASSEVRDTKVREFVKERDVALPVGYVAWEKCDKIFSVGPATFIVDAKGVVQDYAQGSSEERFTLFAKRIKKLLAGQDVFPEVLAEYGPQLEPVINGEEPKSP